MSLHDIYMIHGANRNLSPQRRAGVAIRYMPGSSVFERGLMETSNRSGYMVDFANRPIWLLRGQGPHRAQRFHHRPPRRGRGVARAQNAAQTSASTRSTASCAKRDL